VAFQAGRRAFNDASGHVVISLRGYLSPGSRTPKFSFTRINGRSDSVREELDHLASGARALPVRLAGLLDTCDAAAKDGKKMAVAERTASLEAKAQALIESGVDPASVRQQCFPRSFVVTFEDRPRRSRDQSDRRPAANTASLVAQFSSLVSLLVDIGSPHDEVVIKLTSPGGGVAEYGQLAMQLLRLRKAGISTTVCVDTVAASGGYMAACVADRVSEPMRYSAVHVGECTRVHVRVRARRSVRNSIACAGECGCARMREERFVVVAVVVMMVCLQLECTDRNCDVGIVVRYAMMIARHIFLHVISSFFMCQP
jgi:hypothetical protein